MNYLALRNSAISFRLDASQDSQVKDAMKIAYEHVWNAAEWYFKKVQEVPINLDAANPTLPSDFGHSLQIFDDYGNELESLEDREFEARYRPMIAQGFTGRPEAFKVVNRKLYVAPTPDRTYVGTIGYERRMGHFNAAGGFVAGNMTVDTDQPLWPDFTSEDHHMVLVPFTLEFMLSAETDYYTKQMIQDQSARALAAMVEDLSGQDVGVGNREYGADSL